MSAALEQVAYTVLEDAGSVNICVTLSGVSAREVNVDVMAMDGSALGKKQTHFISAVIYKKDVLVGLVDFTVEEKAEYCSVGS